MPNVLSPEAVAHYHAEGFVAPVPCLGPAEVARYRSHFEAFEYGFGGRPLGMYQFKPYLHQRWAYGPDGIRVASLSPGAVLTTRLEDRYGSLGAAADALSDRYAAGRLGQPEEIAAAVFLASDEAAFLTGSDLLIDSGYTAR